MARSKTIHEVRPEQREGGEILENPCSKKKLFHAAWADFNFSELYSSTHLNAPGTEIRMAARIPFSIQIMKRLSKEQFLALLRRHRMGDLSPEEARFLSAYYNALRKKHRDRMQSDEEMQAEIWQSIDAETATPDRPKPLIGVKQIVWGAAAAILLSLSLGLFFLWQPSTIKAVAKKTEQVPLSPANNMVELPDGSVVILKPGSDIDYPESFDGLPIREVSLTGEAYFDVRHKKGQPFVVRAGKLTTTVLGTTFSIRAQPNGESVTVTVNSGKVRVSDQKRHFGVLLPNQQATYFIAKEEVNQEKIDADAELAWKFDDLVFDDVTVESAIRLLGERFNHTIDLADPELGRKRFTTTFGRDETLESVLTSICVFNDAEFTIDPTTKRISISPN